MKLLARAISHDYRFAAMFASRMIEQRVGINRNGRLGAYPHYTLYLNPGVGTLGRGGGETGGQPVCNEASKLFIATIVITFLNWRDSSIYCKYTRKLVYLLQIHQKTRLSTVNTPENSSIYCKYTRKLVYLL